MLVFKYLLRVENRKISPPLVFCAPAEGVPWNWVPALRVRKLE